jgi:hypothetical protein
MRLEERTIDDDFEAVCAVCGTRLTEQEIHTAREAGPPFLCTQHMAEELPAEDVEVPDEQPGGSPRAV